MCDASCSDELGTGSQVLDFAATSRNIRDQAELCVALIDLIWRFSTEGYVLLLGYD